MISEKLKDKKETLIVIGGYSLIILFVFIIFLPIYKKWKEFDRKALMEEQKVQSLISMGKEYLRISGETLKIKREAFSAGDLSAVTVVQRLTPKGRLSAIKSNRHTFSPDLQIVNMEVKLERLSLSGIGELITTLRQKAIYLKRITLKARYDNPRLYDAIAVFSALEKP
ncbi:MAG: hypothetical protein AB1488_07500 [Nitrospirota bacterium]